jgi:hypothetical protein
MKDEKRVGEWENGRRKRASLAHAPIHPFIFKE